MPFDYKTIKERYDKLKADGKLTEVQADFLYKIHVNSFYPPYAESSFLYVPEGIGKTNN